MHKTPSLDTLLQYKESNYNFRERRHPQWTTNYELYRDTVITNRLTQRQSVNVPLTKETIRTMLSRIDDAPEVLFEDKGNDKDKDLYFNAYWQHCYDANRLDLVDIQDKKQEMLYGRSFIKLNLKDGLPYLEAIDPFNVLVDRYVDPKDIETAGNIIHTGIFRRLKDIELNPNYDKETVKRLKIYYATKEGLIKAEDNLRLYQEQNQRMEDMGVSDLENPILGETWVELNEYMMKFPTKDGVETRVITVCGNEILQDKPMKDVLGVNFYPMVSWADDIERTDFWSDGVADIVRVPNQIANIYLSQMLENRTLRNFNMNFYDSTAKDGWMPQSYDPAPFGWYPLPGKPQEVFQPVQIPALTDSLNELQFVIGLGEKATAATSIEKGSGPDKQITLGEIQLLAAKANERITSISKFYRQNRRELADKWQELVNANRDSLAPVKLFRKSPSGQFQDKLIKPSDWFSKEGYTVKMMSTVQKESEAMDKIQKMRLLKQELPMNPIVSETYVKTLVDFADIDRDRAKEIIEYEKQAANQSQMMPQGKTMDNMMPAQPQMDVAAMLQMEDQPKNPLDVALEQQNSALSMLNNA